MHGWGRLIAWDTVSRVSAAHSPMAMRGNWTLLRKSLRISAAVRGIALHLPRLLGHWHDDEDAGETGGDGGVRRLKGAVEWISRLDARIDPTLPISVKQTTKKAVIAGQRNR